MIILIEWAGSLVSRFNDIIHLMLHVIMYLIFYFSIGFVTAFGTYHMFTINVICEIRHIPLVQAFVLKPLIAGLGKILAI